MQDRAPFAGGALAARRAPAARPGTALPAHGAAPRARPLADHEVQQAAYGLAAQLQGDPVDHPDDQRRLPEANQVMEGTRRVLRHGRGNVERSDGQDLSRVQARLELIGRVQDRQGINACTGMAMALGVGNCDEHALVAARLAAPRLSPGEFVQVVGNETPFGHTWAEWLPPAPPAGAPGAPADVIVMDAWASGPAVRGRDAARSSQSAVVDVDERFDLRSGVAALSEARRMRRLVDPGGPFAGWVATRLAAIERTEPWPGRVFDEPSTVSPAFAAGAAAALSALPALDQAVMAVGAQRQVHGLSVAAATAPDAIDRVLHQTMSLDRPARRPDVPLP